MSDTQASPTEPTPPVATEPAVVTPASPTVLVVGAEEPAPPASVRFERGDYEDLVDWMKMWVTWRAANPTAPIQALTSAEVVNPADETPAEEVPEDPNAEPKPVAGIRFERGEYAEFLSWLKTWVAWHIKGAATSDEMTALTARVEALEHPAKAAG